jgi:hypothetical protein
MPLAADGTPMISFAIERGGDARFEGTRTIRVRRGARTIAKIAANRGHRELAVRIREMNNVRSVYKKLKVGRHLKIPDKLSSEFYFHVRAGDTAPTITQGYARIETINRSERAGLSVFAGFDPAVMSVPVRFEGVDTDRKGGFQQSDGSKVENDIRELERMAGRGNFPGAARGPSAVIRVATTKGGNRSKPYPLIPLNYQWTPNNPHAPLWWISGIEWDADPIRNPYSGERVRQLAVIELTQYVRPVSAASVVTRKKMRGKKGGK